MLSNPSIKRKVTIRNSEIYAKATNIKIGIMGDTYGSIDVNDY